MDQLAIDRRKHVEAHLFSSGIGCEVLDAIVQANIKIEAMTDEEIERIMARFTHSRCETLHSNVLPAPAKARPAVYTG